MSALQKINGVYRLYRLCPTSKSGKKFDSHGLLICNVMRNCLVSNKLPVTSMNSPYKVNHPHTSKQSSSPDTDYVPSGRDGEVFSTSDEPMMPEEPVSSDDFGITIDHYTRGFFDPGSILNTNLGHPKKAMTEPNELRLKNLFSLVSLQDETNLPFSRTSSNIDLRLKENNLVLRSDQKVNFDASVRNRRISRERRVDEDVGQLFDTSAISKLSTSHRSPIKGTTESCESERLDECSEVFDDDQEDSINLVESSASNSLMSYESFFEEFFIAEKLLSKQEFSCSSDLLQQHQLRKQTISSKNFTTDFSFNCNKTSNNTPSCSNGDDTLSFYSGCTNNRAANDLSFNNSIQTKSSESSSEASVGNRNDRRTSDIELNLSTSNKTIPFTDYPIQVSRSANQSYQKHNISSASLEELYSCSSECSSECSNRQNLQVPARGESLSNGSTVEACQTLDALQNYMSANQSGNETSKLFRKKSSLSQKSPFQFEQPLPTDKQRNNSMKTSKMATKSSHEVTGVRSIKTFHGKSDQLRTSSPSKRTSNHQQNVSKRLSKVNQLTVRGKASPCTNYSEREVPELLFSQEELHQRLSSRWSAGAGAIPLSKSSQFNIVTMHCCDSRGSEAALANAQPPSSSYERLNRDVERYLDLASQTMSVGKFQRVAYPDLHGHMLPPDEECSLPHRRIDLLRNRLMDDVRRELEPGDLVNLVVYNLDDIINCQNNMKANDIDTPLCNDDEKYILNYLNDPKKTTKRCQHLNFDSQFESGNLRKVIQVRNYEYDLILTPDVNTRGQHQWFYFRVTDMKADVPYRFNVINCEKANSQFNFGMQPLLFSVAEAVLGRPYWVRAGDEVCYYRNHLLKSPHLINEIRLTNLSFYHTATFTITFRHSPDVCYLAYHYPYPYTMLMHYLDQLENTNNSQSSSNITHLTHGGTHDPEKQNYNSGNNAEPSDTNFDGLIDSSNTSDSAGIEPVMTSNQGDGSSNNNAGRSNRNPTQSTSVIYLRTQNLCRTIGGNNIPLVTITALPVLTGHMQTDLSTAMSIKNRPYVFLSARVHPGESNSSWVMRGTLDYLLSECDNARQLRETFIFKIIPMLNPDGVINGNHRSSLYGEDLNRHWLEPSLSKHSSIFHTKALMLYLQSKSTVGIYSFCDFHGHSRKKNIFIYGCSPLRSWLGNEDLQNPTIRQERIEDESYKIIPTILGKIAPGFHLPLCNFSVEKTKETCARVVVWRQVGVIKSYTMESSYCGFDHGPYKGLQINTYHHEEMGKFFLLAVGMSRAHLDDVSSFVAASDLDEPEQSKSKTSEKRLSRDHSKSDSSESFELEEMMDELNEDMRDQGSDNNVFRTAPPSGLE